MSKLTPLVVLVGLLCGLYSSSLSRWIAATSSALFTGANDNGARQVLRLKPISSFPSGRDQERTAGTFENLAQQNEVLLRLGEDLSKRSKLDTAWTYRGVNEHGLCFDWLSPKASVLSSRQDSPAVVALSQELLESCRSADEVIDFYLANYKELDGQGTAVVVDRSGSRAVVAWSEGEVILEKSQPLTRTCCPVDEVTLQ